jgi:hypothetical protein
MDEQKSKSEYSVPTVASNYATLLIGYVVVLSGRNTMKNYVKFVFITIATYNKMSVIS